VTFGRKLAEHQERRAAERERNMEALLVPSRSLHKGSYAADMGNPVSVPKSEPYRDQALLEMARGRPCLLMIPAVCSHRVDTVVAAHSNLPEHGKAMGRKADDEYTAFACFACHTWLDTSKAAGAQKAMAFQLAHARQVLAWRLIAMDPNEPERFRRAARRALERLGVTTGATA
jgi:hypothetical protein